MRSLARAICGKGLEQAGHRLIGAVFPNQSGDTEPPIPLALAAANLQYLKVLGDLAWGDLSPHRRSLCHLTRSSLCPKRSHSSWSRGDGRMTLYDPPLIEPLPADGF